MTINVLVIADNLHHIEEGVKNSKKKLYLNRKDVIPLT
jgi:hypothetical protein